MKQKYNIHRDAEHGQLVIQEFAELDKEMFSLLCEERYPEDAIRAAIAGGTTSLITAFRTRNFYPSYAFAARIAATIVSIFEKDSTEPVEVLIDDAEFLSRQRPEPAIRPETEEEGEDIDELLDEPVDEEFDDIDIDKINSGIKIADDDPADIDDEV